MNLNVHLHSLVLDGVFTPPTPTAAPVFHALPPPTDEEIGEILEQVHDRVRRLLGRRGRLPEEPSPTDPVAEQMPLLAGDASASIQELVASGPRAGHPVRRLRSAAAVVDVQKPRCARLEGFSLHANVALPAHARDALEHLCRIRDAMARRTCCSIPWSSSRKCPCWSPRLGFICFDFMASWLRTRPGVRRVSRAPSKMSTQRPALG